MSFLGDTGMQVISGGQTGADLAGLRAAQALGFRTGGQAPKGWKTTAGPQPALTAFGLIEGKGGYHDRTVTNVMMSDATLILATKPESSGTALTVKTCIKYKKQYKIIDLKERSSNGLIQETVAWVKTNSILPVSMNGGFILNVAGNSSRSVPGIFMPAFNFMLTMLMLLRDDDDTAPDWQEVKTLFSKLLDPRTAQQLQDNFQVINELMPRCRTVVIDDTCTKL